MSDVNYRTFYPPPTNAQHTNSCNSQRSQFVHWETLTARTLCEILLRKVRFFVSFRTATPHFRTILKACIYSETSCPLPFGTVVTHSTSVSFLPRVSEKPVAAKKKKKASPLLELFPSCGARTQPLYHSATAHSQLHPRYQTLRHFLS